MFKAGRPGHAPGMSTRQDGRLDDLVAEGLVDRHSTTSRPESVLSGRTNDEL
jgi:hypothetical protein